MRVLYNAFCLKCKGTILVVTNSKDAIYFWVWKCLKCGNEGRCPKEYPIEEHE